MSATAPLRAAVARAAAPSPSRAPFARAEPRPAAQPGWRPDLRVVAPRQAVAGRVAFILVIGGILAAGLVTLLMLHTLAAQDAFTLHRLQYQHASLTDLEQQLSVADQQDQAPSALAARARALGLRPATSLSFVRRRNGTIVAVSSAPPVYVPPAPAPTPSARPSATPAATPSSAPQAKVETKKKARVPAKRVPSGH